MWTAFGRPGPPRSCAAHARVWRRERLHRSGDAEAAQSSEQEAIVVLREAGARPRLALALLERVRRRDEPAALAEARSIYAELGATRWLERVDAELGVSA